MGKVKKEKLTQVAENKNKAHLNKKKKKNCDKKSVEDWKGKYVYILPQSVKMMAETVGIPNLPDDVANSLSEDVSYRLRNIIQLCSKYLKHTRHKRLTCKDVNEVLEMSDISPIIGHGSQTSPHSFFYEHEAGVHVLDDPVVDLTNYALTEITTPIRATPYVTLNWLSPDDYVKVKVTDEIKSESVDGAGNKSYSSTNHVSNSHIKQEVDVKNNENHKVSSDHVNSGPKIPANLIKYYGITCNTILGHNDLKLVLRDLSHNGKIVAIVPYLLNFITITLRRLSSERQIERLLLSLEALTENRNVDFTLYSPVARVANVLLKIINTSATRNSPLSHNHVLRIRAAQVLSKVLLKWCGQVEQQDNVEHVGQLLSDPDTPPIVLVGSLSLLTELGHKALKKAFWNIADKFIAFLEQLRQDRHPLELALLNAAKVLYRNAYDQDDVPNAPLLDGLLYEYFGDALCPIRLNVLENFSLTGRYLPASGTDVRRDKVVVKKPLCLPKFMNSTYNPRSRKLTIHSAFSIPRRKNHKIIFKFKSARSVPEINLKRRRMDTPYSQFIAGKLSEGHVVLVGKTCKKTKRKSLSSYASLFTLL